MLIKPPQHAAPQGIAGVEPEQDNHKVEMVTGKTKEKYEGEMQWVPANHALGKHHGEVGEVEEGPAEVGQSCASQALFKKFKVVQATAGEQVFVIAYETVAGDKEEGRDAVAAKHL